MRFSKAFIFLFCVLFAAFAVVFNTFPRSSYSELEKRELKRFPLFTPEKLFDGSFTSEVSSWFSDSEPFRDHFMALSMQIKDLIRMETGEENITFHATASDPEPESPEPTESTDIQEVQEDSAYNYENHITADENAKIANAGIIIVGTGEKVRALMAYGGTAKGCTGYARAANKYKDTFPDVNVYCMVIPTAVEYYCPDKVRNRTRPALITTGHRLEPIMQQRNSPRWPKYLSARCLITNGRSYTAMWGACMAIPRTSPSRRHPRTLSTMYLKVSVTRRPIRTTPYHVTGMGRPYKGVFFYRFKNGSGGAYCTFMGSDTKITCVRTSTQNGRRLLILKDSFGNALPGYLFYSFEEVHVIDSRYFTKNMVDYVYENGITDILFANNIFKAYSSHTYSNYLRFLTQTGGIPKRTKPIGDSLQQVKPAAKDSITAPAATIPVAPKDSISSSF